jgi:hypothetical protein
MDIWIWTFIRIIGLCQDKDFLEKVRFKNKVQGFRDYWISNLYSITETVVVRFP